jgi:hypothetical protein
MRRNSATFVFDVEERKRREGDEAMAMGAKCEKSGWLKSTDLDGATFILDVIGGSSPSNFFGCFGCGPFILPLGCGADSATTKSEEEQVGTSSPDNASRETAARPPIRTSPSCPVIFPL